MILAEKIIKLRKHFGWSQEELAEKLAVSRQSVSKWESTNSVPDLNKIIKLAEIFSVSTDFLLKDELETTEYLSEAQEANVAQISLEQALNFVDIKITEARLITKGVMLSMMSVVPLFMLLALAETNQFGLTKKMAAALGIVAILMIVSLAVSFFIKTNQHKKELQQITGEHFELAYGVHSALSQKLENFRALYYQRLSLAVFLFIFSSVPLMMSAIFSASGNAILMMLCLLFIIIALGIYFVMPVSTEFEAYQYLLVEGDLDAGKSDAIKQAEKLAAFFWPLVLAIYLAWSLWTMHWGVTWIVFPISAAVFAALVGLMGMIKKTQD